MRKRLIRVLVPTAVLFLLALIVVSWFAWQDSTPSAATLEIKPTAAQPWQRTEEGCLFTFTQEREEPYFRQVIVANIGDGACTIVIEGPDGNISTGIAFRESEPHTAVMGGESAWKLYVSDWNETFTILDTVAPGDWINQPRPTANPAESTEYGALLNGPPQ